MSVLVAGIGNIFLGDDGFGSGGFDLTNALLDADGPAVLVDALPRGGAPGTLDVLEPSPSVDGEPGIEPHRVDPATVLSEHDDQMQVGLSPAVEAAVSEAVAMIERLVGELERSVVRGRSGSVPRLWRRSSRWAGLHRQSARFPRSNAT